MRSWVWRPSVNGMKMCQYEISLGGPCITNTFCLLLFGSFSGVFSSPLCSSHETTRISKDIIMWLVPAGPRAFGSEKTIVCFWAMRKKEQREPKDRFALLSCQDFSGIEVSWQPQNYFTFPALDPFSLFFSPLSLGQVREKHNWRVLIPALTCCVTVDELFEFSTSQFLHLQTGD